MLQARELILILTLNLFFVSWFLRLATKSHTTYSLEFRITKTEHKTESKI